MASGAPRLSVEQVRRIPRDGSRYELLDGELVVTPGQSTVHQEVVLRLAGELRRAVERPGLAHVLTMGELEHGAHTLLRPDLLVYPAIFPPGTPWNEIEDWWLAVEVESPSTRQFDRTLKREVYQAIGVREIWLVDPAGEAVGVWAGSDPEGGVVRQELRWRPAELHTEVVISLVRLFEGLPPGKR